MPARHVALVMVGLVSVVGLCATAFGIATPATAAYPERPIRIVVPVPPGGGNDIVARLLAQRLGDKCGQQVIVDNRPGASTAIGAEIVACATPMAIP